MRAHYRISVQKYPQGVYCCLSQPCLPLAAHDSATLELFFVSLLFIHQFCSSRGGGALSQVYIYVAALRWLAAAVRTTARWSACCLRLCSPSDFSRIQLRFRVKIRRLLASFSCVNPFCRSHSPTLKSNLKNAATRLRRHRRTSGR